MDGVRILVAEDEVVLAETVRRGLVAEGFECDVVHDGLDALWRAREHQYASIVLDLFTRTCHRGASEIRLTAREHAVLWCLLRRDGGVASKEELVEEVWGPDFEGDPNIVEVYVGYLRRKVDQPFGVATLQTVRGVGYRVV